MREADLIVIGAGPAGMAAARTAADAGLSVTVLDEQPRAGGQIYRDVERSAATRGHILGPDFTKGQELTAGMKHPNITHINRAIVWQVENSTRVAFTVNDEGQQIEGKRLLIATGALERPMPVPGWTLPRVMTAGAAQILIKQSGMVFENAVLCGSGPLLYLLAVQMCRAGTPPKALVETRSFVDTFAAVSSYWTGALKGWKVLTKGLGFLSELRKADVKRYKGASDISIEGDQQAETLRFKSGGCEHRLECGTVLLHHGVVPNTQMSRSMGLAHKWNDLQRAFVPKKDEWGRSTKTEVFIAGDGAGIGGATAAASAGCLAGLEIACDLEAISKQDRDRQAQGVRAKLEANLAVRPFIDRAYPPFAEALAPADKTIICRCEEVTAGDIRRYAKTGGCLGPNQTKAFGRSGMGPCQGRYCGLTVTELLAKANNQTPEETGYYTIRPPIKPVTLKELAGLSQKNKDADAKDAAA